MKFLFCLFGVSGFVFSNKTIACDCSRGSVEYAAKNTAFIAAGKILSKELFYFLDSTKIKRYADDTINSKYHRIPRGTFKYKFLIVELIKGKISSDTITIFSQRYSDMCGYIFDVDSSYIVYNSEFAVPQINGRNYYPFKMKENEFFVTRCSRTMPFNQVEIDELRKYLPKRK